MKKDGFYYQKSEYESPDFLIDESKKVVYDANGFPKSVVNIADEPENPIKSDLKIVKILVIILVILCAGTLLAELLFHYSPAKWQHEMWRPLLMYDFMKNWEISNNEINAVVNFENKLTGENKNNLYSDYYDGDDVLVEIADGKSEYNLYFKTPEQAEELLGEANPHNYTPPETPDSQINGIEYRAYYCYGGKTNSKWIVIKYLGGWSVEVETERIW